MIPFQDFSTGETMRYEKLAIIGQDRKTVQYTWNGREYRSKNGRPLPGTPSQDRRHGQGRARDVLRRNGCERETSRSRKNRPLRYYEEGNPSRYMEETYPGQVTTYHSGWLVVELLLHLGLLIVWFLCMWLLLRFQWSHAVGLAVVAWLISIFVLPMILTPAENVRKENLKKAAETALFYPQISRSS